MVLQERSADFSPKFEVAACFCENRGKILLLHRQDHKPQGNTWGIPAGKGEPGETAAETAVREIWEEIKIRVPVERLKFIQTVMIRYKDFDFNYHMFRTELGSRHIRLNRKEHKNRAWVTPQEALNYKLIEDEDACIKNAYNCLSRLG